METDRQTDRQKNSLTPYMGLCGFYFQLNLLPPYLLRSQGDKRRKKYAVTLKNLEIPVEFLVDFPMLPHKSQSTVEIVVNTLTKIVYIKDLSGAHTITCVKLVPCNVFS